MNVGLITETLYSNIGREDTLQTLSQLTQEADNVYLQFPDKSVREFPREALSKEFYQSINAQLDSYASTIDRLLDSKELVEWKWKQDASTINQQIADVQAQANKYISSFVDEHFPQAREKPSIAVHYTDRSIPWLASEPEQVFSRYQAENKDVKTPAYSMQLVS